MNRDDYIIQITSPDGTITDHVGPFESEEIADAYCKANLEPRMLKAKFLITNLTDPKDLLASIV